jgi:hypothetical protein
VYGVRREPRAMSRAGTRGTLHNEVRQRVRRMTEDVRQSAAAPARGQ